MSRTFIAKPKIVAEYLRHLRLLKADTWEPIYLDPTSKAQWVGYRIDDNPGDQPPTMLRLKEMSLDVVCTAATRTSFDDEAAAAGHYIRWNIPSDASFIGFITALEVAVSTEPTERTYKNVIISLAWSGLNEPFNFRPVVGKSIQAVNADYAYYEAISKRAESLAALATKQLGCELRKNRDVFRDC